MRVYVDAQRRKARRLVDAELFSSVTQVEHTCPWGEARTEVFNDPLDKDVLASRRERYMSVVRVLDHQARIDELVDGAAAHGFPSVWRVALSVVIGEGLHDLRDAQERCGRIPPMIVRPQAQQRQQRQGRALVLLCQGKVQRAKDLLCLLDLFANRHRVDSLFMVSQLGDELADQAIYGALVRHHFANQRPQSFELLLRGVSKDPKIGCVHLRMTTELPEMDIDNGGVQVQGQSTRKPRVEPTTVLVIDVEVIFEADALAGDALRVMNGSYHTSRLLLGGEALDEHVALIRHEQRLCRRGVEQRVRFFAPPLRPGDEAIGEVR